MSASQLLTRVDVQVDPNSSGVTRGSIVSKTAAVFVPQFKYDELVYALNAGNSVVITLTTTSRDTIHIVDFGVSLDGDPTTDY